MEVSDLFHDLDLGMRPISVIAPYLPIPAHFKRDRCGIGSGCGAGWNRGRRFLVLASSAASVLDLVGSGMGLGFRNGADGLLWLLSLWLWLKLWPHLLRKSAAAMQWLGVKDSARAQPYYGSEICSAK